MARVVSITVDLDKIAEFAQKVSQDNGGLESSSGVTPSEFEYAWSNMRGCINSPELVKLVQQVINILVDADEAHKDS